MKPKKNKFYSIACLGPYEYCKWGGVAKYTGYKETWDIDGEEKIVYEFKHKDFEEKIGEEIEDTAFFFEEDIIAEVEKP